MMNIMKERWDRNCNELKKALAEADEEWLHDVSYKDLVVFMLQEIWNNDNDQQYYNGDILDLERITEIDDGAYQGTMLYMVPFDTYQPAPHQYLMLHNYYGSCCGCDSLQGAQCGDKPAMVHDIYNICLDLAESAVVPYNKGWCHNEKYDDATMAKEPPEKIMDIPFEDVLRILAIYKETKHAEQDYVDGFCEGVKYAESVIKESIQKQIDKVIVNGENKED